MLFQNVQSIRTSLGEITRITRMPDRVVLWDRSQFRKYVIFTATNGNEVKYLSSETTDTLAYVNNSKVVQSPYINNENISAFNTVTEVDDQTSGIANVADYAFYHCSSLYLVSLPSATSIGERAFNYCSSLYLVSLPSATSIGVNAFGYCSNLSSVSLLKATSIGSYAFYDCTSLSLISLPAVDLIDTAAFQYCTSLSILDMSERTNEEIPSVQTNSFSNDPLVSVIVPDTMYYNWTDKILNDDTYANWKTLSTNNQIVLVPYTKPTPVFSSKWDNIVSALENASEDDFDKTTLEYIGENDVLKSIPVSGLISVAYDLNPEEDGHVVSSNWINLGFNASIPEYVKYKDSEGNKVYVCSLKNDMLSDITIGDEIYTKSFDELNLNNTYTSVDNELITAVDSSTFSYGNNYVEGSYDARYSVPKTITTSKGTYTFCGYNLTLNSQTLLGVMNDSSVINSCQFSSSKSTKYSSSDIRTWLNSTSSCGSWSGSETGSGTPKMGLIGRLSSDDELLKNITKTVNRTWVYGTDTSTFECIADAFWLLGEGHVNIRTIYLQDDNKDTSNLSTVFTDVSHKIKNNMDSDGGNTGSAGEWWLRSARSDVTSLIGSICSDDGIAHGTGVNHYHGVSPACLIG